MHFEVVPPLAATAVLSLRPPLESDAKRKEMAGIPRQCHLQSETRLLKVGISTNFHFVALKSEKGCKRRNGTATWLAHVACFGAKRLARHFANRKSSYFKTVKTRRPTRHFSKFLAQGPPEGLAGPQTSARCI